MEKIIKETLSHLGCSEKESKFFIANYTLGPASIIAIAKEARLERSTAYLVAEQLLQKGLLIEDLKRYKKLLITIEPKTLLRMLTAKQRQIGRNELILKEHLPSLQAAYLASEIRPKVRTYEGKKGLLDIRRDILEKKQEITLWTNQETESKFFSKEYHQSFIAERIRRSIPIKVLAVTNDEGKKLINNAKEELRTIKLLPKSISFSAETYIYGNKVAILDYHKDIIGVLIESEPIAKAQRAIFELNWNQL